MISLDEVVNGLLSGFAGAWLVWSRGNREATSRTIAGVMYNAEGTLKAINRQAPMVEQSLQASRAIFAKLEANEDVSHKDFGPVLNGFIATLSGVEQIEIMSRVDRGAVEVVKHYLDAVTIWGKFEASYRESLRDLMQNLSSPLKLEYAGRVVGSLEGLQFCTGNLQERAQRMIKYGRRRELVERRSFASRAERKVTRWVNSFDRSVDNERLRG